MRGQFGEEEDGIRLARPRQELADQGATAFDCRGVVEFHDRVGPDLAPFFTDAEDVASALAAAAPVVRDPVWRLPFWDPYEVMIEPGIADLDNAPKGGFAGSITAALFLRRFADVAPYVHFDIYGWQPAAAPGRPKGGVGQGARALLDALPRVLDL